MKAPQFFLWVIVPLLVSCNDDDPQTETINLKLDGYTEGGASTFNGGFVAGEEAAVTLGPVANTFKVTHVNFLFGGTGNPVVRDIILHIYEDNGSANPGDTLYSSAYSLSSLENQLQQIDLADEGITMDGGGSIRISIQFTDAGLPCVARDDDGTIMTTKNWIKDFGGTWYTSNSLGVIGDWIIRATVEENK